MTREDEILLAKCIALEVTIKPAVHNGREPFFGVHDGWTMHWRGMTLILTDGTVTPRRAYIAASERQARMMALHSVVMNIKGWWAPDDAIRRD